MVVFPFFPKRRFRGPVSNKMKSGNLRRFIAKEAVVRIAGLQKLTLLDYPGLTAATVFTPGCNLRCPFCHNGELIGTETTDAESAYGLTFGSSEEVLSFLRTRHRLLDGVCISGGEPLLQPEIDAFCRSLKDLGFAVKLDTNGTQPDRLRALLDAGLIDYVAMDVKNTPGRYAETVGCADVDLDAIQQSMRLLMMQDPAKGGATYEFRTTVVRELHTRDDLVELAYWIADDARELLSPVCPPWFVQNFKDSSAVLAGQGTLHPWDADELRSLYPKLWAILPTVSLRGVE